MIKLGQRCRWVKAKKWKRDYSISYHLIFIFIFIKITPFNILVAKISSIITNLKKELLWFISAEIGTTCSYKISSSIYKLKERIIVFYIWRDWNDLFLCKSWSILIKSSVVLQIKKKKNYCVLYMVKLEQPILMWKLIDI